MKARAGRRPLSANCSHQDHLQLFFFFFSVIFLWSYSLSGPGMDVAEASKHGKKSTSQKLEDQKKVGRIFFECCLHITLFFFLFLLRSCVAFHLLLFHMSFCDWYAKSVSSKSKSAYCWFVVCVPPPPTECKAWILENLCSRNWHAV